jgi:molybdopterin-containing oxidoreductase family membrane subunit
MLEKAIQGSRLYWGWIIALLALIGIGFLFYLTQYFEGLKVTGMSRDVSWGFYIAQLTYLVGVAASGVMVVLPFYLHDYKAFGRITILGEFVAISSVVMCILFVLVDLGKPTRFLNVMLYPRPNSVLFWDANVLSIYLLLNLVIGWNVLSSERKGIHYPAWVKPLIYISIPWAFSIHTVTAFLYSGLPGRHYWLTAILAARFLSSAFCSGPALLILLCMIVRKFTRFDPGIKQMRTLALIVTYAMIFNVFFFFLEIFTAFYSQIPGHMVHFQYLFAGYEGHTRLVPWMWTAAFFALVSLILLINPTTRKNERTMMLGCMAVVIATWIDKGLGLLIGGFTPNTFERVTDYWPTLTEFMISVMVWAIGLFVLTILFKVAVSVKEEVEGVS